MERYTGSEAGQRLLQMLVRDDVFARMMLDADAICEVVPEIRDMIGFNQCNPHHPYDAWVHTAHCVAFAAPDPVLRLTLLLHDIGKPSTFYRTEGIVGHFHRHEAKGEKMVRERLPTLGFDESTIETVAVLVRNHDRVITEAELGRWLDELGEERLKLLLDVKEADARAHDKKFNKIQLAKILVIRQVLDEI